jgi:hypothetical protein
MKKTIIAAVMLYGLILIVASCAASRTCEPVVISTNTDYTHDPMAVPYYNTHEIFAETYSGADLCIELRDEIIDRMREKAESINEDPQVLYHCIKSTYPDWNARPNRIPCYAEKCRYQLQDIWAIAFNRANSFDEETLSHFDLYFVSCTTYDTLYHTGCFAID